MPKKKEQKEPKVIVIKPKQIERVIKRQCRFSVSPWECAQCSSFPEICCKECTREGCKMKCNLWKGMQEVSKWDYTPVVNSTSSVVEPTMKLSEIIETKAESTEEKSQAEKDFDNDAPF